MIVYLIMLAFSANGGLRSIALADESYNCVFDTGFCSWRQPSDDDFDWSRGTSIPSQEAGITGGQATSRGNFAYIVTTSRTDTEKARLVSGIIEPTDQALLDFQYSFLGAKTNTLNVYLQDVCEEEKRTLISSKTSNGESDWLMTYESFKSSTPFIIVIEGVVGSSYTGSIAIDDIGFKADYKVPTTQNVTTTQLTTTTSITEMTSPRTTTVPKSSETVDMSMIIIDDTPPKLNDPNQSETLLAIVFAALKNVFGHLPGILRIDIYTVKSDTVHVHYGVTIDRGVSTAAVSLSLAIVKVAKNGQITVGNTQHRITDFQLKSKNEKSVNLSATSDVCIVHQAIFPCDPKHACDIIDDLPICVLQKQCDRHLIVALSISIPIVIISVFAVLVIFCTRKRKERTSTKSRRSIDDGQLSRIREPTRYSSWHTSFHNNPAYRCDVASSSRSELGNNSHLKNQRKANDAISTYERDRLSKSSKNSNKDEVKIIC